MAQLVTDNFNRANASSLGANWTQYGTFGGGFIDGITSNQLSSPGKGNDFNADLYTAISWPNDQYSEGTIIAQASADDTGPGVRLQNPGGAQNQQILGYFASVNPNDTTALGSSATHGILRVTSGPTFTLIATFTGVVSANDVIRIVAQGTLISMYQNAVLKCSATDSNFASGYPGMYTSENSGVTTAILWDNWAGGDLTVPYQPQYLLGPAGAY